VVVGPEHLGRDVAARTAGGAGRIENRMSLHRLTTVTVGVPNLDESRKFYRDFGLTEKAPGHFSTRLGGEQLVLVERPDVGFSRLALAAPIPTTSDAWLHRLPVPDSMRLSVTRTSGHASR